MVPATELLFEDDYVIQKNQPSHAQNKLCNEKERRPKMICDPYPQMQQAE